MAKEILNLKPGDLWKYFYDLTQIPRPTHHTEAVRQYIRDFATNLSLNYDEDAVGNIVIRKPASSGYEQAPVVIIQSHVDMVPQANSNVKHDFLKDPIDAYIEGNIVTARDTTLGADNGIGVAAMLALLADASLKHPALEALFTVDEEEGMVGAFELQPGFLKGKILLNLDTEDEGELCIGCAGGADITATFGYKDEENVYTEDVAYQITLKGLRGGHSGGEIHLGRANANKLMFRFLKEAVRECDARLASVNGGSLRNAIPREAFAVLIVDKDRAEELEDLVRQYQEIYKEEYQDIENAISFTAQKGDFPATLLPQEIQDAVIHAVEACQNGVISMLTSFPGIVETSSNMARVQTEPGKITVSFLARSSSESRKEQICSAIESAFSLAGAKVEIGNNYPGWQPDAHSKVKDVMAELFEKMFGRKAHVNVVHAGLECGIILGSTPGLDIVSFGPTIKAPHSPDEYVEIDTVERFWKFLVATLEHIK